MQNQNYTEKCRNGVNCYYNARGQCWFYHPENEIYPFGINRFFQCTPCRYTSIIDEQLIEASKAHNLNLIE